MGGQTGLTDEKDQKMASTSHFKNALLTKGKKIFWICRLSGYLKDKYIKNYFIIEAPGCQIEAQTGLRW